MDELDDNPFLEPPDKNAALKAMANALRQRGQQADTDKAAGVFFSGLGQGSVAPKLGEALSKSGMDSERNNREYAGQTLRDIISKRQNDRVFAHQKSMEEQASTRQDATEKWRQRNDERMTDQNQERNDISRQGLGIQRQALANGNFVPFTTPGGMTMVMNHKTGKAEPVDLPAADPASETAEQPMPGPASKGYAAFMRELGNLRNDLDPLARRSGLQGNQARMQASERIKKIGLESGGDIKNLDKTRMTELAGSMASMIASGGHPPESMVKDLTPETVGNWPAKIESWLTNNPHGTDQQAYVKQMINQANQEEETIGGQIRNAQLSRLAGYKETLFKGHPQAMWAIARAHGLDPKMINPETFVPLERYSNPDFYTTPKLAIRNAISKIKAKGVTDREQIKKELKAMGIDDAG